MKYRFSTHKRVEKFLEKHNNISRRFALSLQEIIQNPFENTCDIKTIKGKKNSYRLRIGKY